MGGGRWRADSSTAEDDRPVPRNRQDRPASGRRSASRRHAGCYDHSRTADRPVFVKLPGRLQEGGRPGPRGSCHADHPHDRRHRLDRRLCRPETVPAAGREGPGGRPCANALQSGQGRAMAGGGAGGAGQDPGPGRSRPVTPSGFAAGGAGEGPRILGRAGRRCRAAWREPAGGGARSGAITGPALSSRSSQRAARARRAVSGRAPATRAARSRRRSSIRDSSSTPDPVRATSMARVSATAARQSSGEMPGGTRSARGSTAGATRVAPKSARARYRAFQPRKARSRPSQSVRTAATIVPTARRPDAPGAGGTAPGDRSSGSGPGWPSNLHRRSGGGASGLSDRVVIVASVLGPGPEGSRRGARAPSVGEPGPAEKGPDLGLSAGVGPTILCDRMGCNPLPPSTRPGEP